METEAGETAIARSAAALILAPGSAAALAAHGDALRAGGRYDAALRALQRAVTADPGQRDHLFALGCLLRDLGETGQAAGAFSRAAAVGGNWGLARLQLWRLLVGAGQIGNTLPFGLALAGDCPEHALEVLSEIALDHARRGQWAEAQAAYRRLAEVHPGIRAMLGDGFMPGDGLPDRAPPTARRDPDAMPPLAHRFAAAWDAGGWQGRRIVVLTAKHIGCDPRFIEYDLAHYMMEAAAASGLDALFIAADDVTYPALMTPERRRDAPANLQSIAARIRDFAPDIVTIDCNALSSAETVNPAWLRRLQAEVPFTVVGIVPDNYGDAYRRIAHWAPAVDAFVHFEPSSGDGGPMILSFVPVPDYFVSRGVRDLAGLFIGSVAGGNLGHRVLWLSALMTQVPGFGVLLGNRLASTAPGFREFAALYGRSKLSANFGGRTDGNVIVTGRTHETIKAGCLLLEQAGSGLDSFYMEGKHFLTFRDAGELVALARRLLADDALRAAMAAEAQAFAEAHYAARFFWPYVIARLDGRPDGPPPTAPAALLRGRG